MSRQPNDENGYSIRRATCADVKGILTCLRGAFSPYESQYSRDAFIDTVLTENTLKDRLDAMTVFVAVDRASCVIGTLGCAVRRGREGHLRGMAVTLLWQGHGVAGRLLAAAEDHLRRCGCTCVTLDTTRPLMRAMRFYERHGYRPTGKVDAYFGMPLLEYRKALAMIPRMKWTERTFDHELPVGLFAVVLERLRGTPLRAAELLTGAGDVSTRRPDSGSWSAQEHIGHLDDLHELDMRRLHEYLTGAAALSSADMTNRATNDANHNATPTHTLIERLSTRRRELIRRLEDVTESDAARSAAHPRLKRQLRLIDWMFFVAEHDDHHLAAARECLLRSVSVGASPSGDDPRSHDVRGR